MVVELAEKGGLPKSTVPEWRGSELPEIAHGRGTDGFESVSLQRRAARTPVQKLHLIPRVLCVSAHCGVLALPS
jgi:hypothetical protein